MKKILSITTILICLVFLFGCTNTQKTLDEEFRFSKDDFIVVDELDTHGGFLGDGAYYLTLDCSKNQEKVDELIKDWKPLPLTENLNKALYEKHYGAFEEKSLPKIENGFYKFIDRHSDVSKETIDASDDSNIFNRYSYNYTIAIYDLDTQTMYYFEYDT